MSENVNEQPFGVMDDSTRNPHLPAEYEQRLETLRAQNGEPPYGNDMRAPQPAGDTGPEIGETYVPDADAEREGYYTGPANTPAQPTLITSAGSKSNPLAALLERNREETGDDGTCTIRVEAVPGDEDGHDWAFVYSTAVTEDDLAEYRRRTWGKQLQRIGTSKPLDFQKAKPYDAGAWLLAEKLVGVLCDRVELDVNGAPLTDDGQPITASSQLFRAAQMRKGETNPPSPDVAMSRWLRKYGADAHTKILFRRAGINADTDGLEVDPTDD